MKKILVAIIAAALLSTGLVAASGVGASATVYPGTVKTKAHAHGVKVKHKHKAKIRTSVGTYGNGRATGKVVFTFVNKKTGKVYTFTKPYRGKATFAFKGLRKGSYKVVVTFVPKKDSVYKPSSSTATVRVK